MKSFVSFCLLFAAAPGLWAQSHSDDPKYHGEPNWKAVCSKAKAGPLASQSPAGPLHGKALTACNERDLYYGFHGKPDYAAALQCGWWQQAHPQTTSGNMFYGPGVLTMLYANGRGVARNEDLAIRFACEEDWAAEAEMEGRIGHLEWMKTPDGAKSTFDLCDDITSGLSMGFCQSLDTDRADVGRDAKVQAIVQALPAAAKQGFPALQAAERKFEEIRTGNEIDLSGTARAMFELQDEKLLRDQFLINLQRFGKGDVPQASAADVAALDAKLNAVYQQIQHAPASKWDGTIKPEGIRKTQQAWLSLRDAWLVFAKTAYPNLSADRVHAQLLRLRIHQLQALVV